MAKYEDYVKADLETEITEAAEATEVRKTDPRIPERFQGKSAEEIAAAYSELERKFGQQANEYGHLRKTVDTLLELQTKSTEAAKPAPEKKPVTVDEIYENADGAVRRVVREEAQFRIEELERKLQEAEQRTQFMDAKSKFEAKHSDYTTTLQDPAFLEWIKASPFRIRQAQAADTGDFDAADDLFSTYAEVSKAKQTVDKSSKRAAVREASLESSGGSAPTATEKFSRSKLQELRINARRGDPASERYLIAHGEAIRQAYLENRLVD